MRSAELIEILSSKHPGVQITACMGEIEVRTGYFGIACSGPNLESVLLEAVKKVVGHPQFALCPSLTTAVAKCGRNSFYLSQ